MTNRFAAVVAKARELGAKEIVNVINWTWAKDFPNPEAGQAFVEWLTANGHDHRGYYAASPESNNENLRADGVRFR